MSAKSNKVVSWESHLVRRAKLGEAVAFELLTDLHRQTLFQLAMRMLRNQDDASDAVQETLLKAYRALPEFDANRPIKPWLCRICTNCCVDAVRDRKREAEPLEQHEYMLQGDDEGPAERVRANLQRRAVLEAVSSLPDRYRQIIFMRHFRHMDVTEIATELNKPEGTVKSWLFRARALLRKQLGPAFG